MISFAIYCFVQSVKFLGSALALIRLNLYKRAMNRVIHDRLTTKISERSIFFFVVCLQQKLKTKSIKQKPTLCDGCPLIRSSHLRFEFARRNKRRVSLSIGVKVRLTELTLFKTWSSDFWGCDCGQTNAIFKCFIIRPFLLCCVNPKKEDGRTPDEPSLQ